MITPHRNVILCHHQFNWGLSLESNIDQLESLSWEFGSGAKGFLFYQPVHESQERFLPYRMKSRNKVQNRVNALEGGGGMMEVLSSRLFTGFCLLWTPGVFAVGR